MKTALFSLASTIAAAIPGAVTTVLLSQRAFAAELATATSSTRQGAPPALCFARAPFTRALCSAVGDGARDRFVGRLPSSSGVQLRSKVKPQEGRGSSGGELSTAPAGATQCSSWLRMRRPSNALRLSSASTDIAAAGISESSTHGSGGGTSSSSFAAAAAFRGGARGEVSQAVESSAVEVEASQMNTLVIDRIEDALGSGWTRSAVVILPLMHLVRLSFGLCLTFYGMAFRTFAFHVIIFRIAGLRQVSKSWGALISYYREARQGIREAAKGAGTIGGRLADGDRLQEARDNMMREKRKLLNDGVLSDEEIAYFMRKYERELKSIIDEQENFKSARSSVFSIRQSVDPQSARASVSGLYNALVASFTASTIPTAGQITLGLHVGTLLKTHVLDMFGAFLDPIGDRLNLDAYYDKEDIPYMGKANAMSGPANLWMNLFCYSTVFVVFRVHPSVALKASMIYYGARVVTDYIIIALESFRRKVPFLKMPLNHSPWSAGVHVALTIAGCYYHRATLSTLTTFWGGIRTSPFAVGPGAVGLLEPVVRFFVWVSQVLNDFHVTSCHFVQDPAEVVHEIAHHLKRD